MKTRITQRLMAYNAAFITDLHTAIEDHQAAARQFKADNNHGLKEQCYKIIDKLHVKLKDAVETQKELKADLQHQQNMELIPVLERKLFDMKDADYSDDVISLRDSGLTSHERVEKLKALLED